MIKAVLFDLDGTLIDTEKYFGRCWIEAAACFGYEMTREEALSLRSLGRPFAPPYIEEMIGHVCSYQELRSKRIERMQAILEKNGVETKAGARELLKWLRSQNITTAVVTASASDYAKKHLKANDLLQYFDQIISAVSVANGKPAPDVYLYACQMLGLDPQECAAVEDSPNGIKSAYRAGCRVIMVPDQTKATAEDQKMLWHEVPQLDSIIPLLKKFI